MALVDLALLHGVALQGCRYCNSCGLRDAGRHLESVNVNVFPTCTGKPGGAGTTVPVPVLR